MPKTAVHPKPDPLRQLSPLKRRELALALVMDERTLLRVLRGRSVRAASRERVRRELEARGLIHLMPAELADVG